MSTSKTAERLDALSFEIVFDQIANRIEKTESELLAAIEQRDAFRAQGRFDEGLSEALVVIRAHERLDVLRELWSEFAGEPYPVLSE